MTLHSVSSTTITVPVSGWPGNNPPMSIRAHSYEYSDVTGSSLCVCVHTHLSYLTHIQIVVTWFCSRQAKRLHSFSDKQPNSNVLMIFMGLNTNSLCTDLKKRNHDSLQSSRAELLFWQNSHIKHTTDCLKAHKLSCYQLHKQQEGKVQIVWSLQATAEQTLYMFCLWVALVMRVRKGLGQ